MLPPALAVMVARKSAALRPMGPRSWWSVVGEHLAMGFGARVGRTGFMGRHWSITHAVLDLDTLTVEEVEVLREELVRRFVRPP